MAFHRVRGQETAQADIPLCPCFLPPLGVRGLAGSSSLSERLRSQCPRATGGGVRDGRSRGAFQSSSRGSEVKDPTVRAKALLPPLVSVPLLCHSLPSRSSRRGTDEATCAQHRPHREIFFLFFSSFSSFLSPTPLSSSVAPNGGCLAGASGPGTGSARGRRAPGAS